MIRKAYGARQNIESDYIQVRDKTLGRVGEGPKRCWQCREILEPHITPHGATCWFSYCDTCRAKRNAA